MTSATVIIDTDPGLGKPGSVIDDGLAIAFALACPDLHVLGLTIVNGNVDAHVGYESATALLDQLGRNEIPVKLGANKPLRQNMKTVWHTFGMDEPEPSEPSGVGAEAGLKADAVEWMLEQVARRPGEITILAIGPMTNIAEAVQADSTFAGNVREILFMAGNATGRVENIDVVADFNVLVDPEAMDIVLRSGVPLRMIGIDQTSRVMLTPQDATEMRNSGRGDSATAWLADYVDGWINHERSSDDTENAWCLLHDPLVVGALVRPELFEFAAFEAHVDLERGEIVTAKKLHEGSESTGSVVAAVDTNVDKFHTYFLERLAAL